VLLLLSLSDDLDELTSDAHDASSATPLVKDSASGPIGRGRDLSDRTRM